MEFFLECSLIVLFYMITESQSASPPYLTDDTGSTIIVSEDTPIGTVLRTLKGTDDDGDDVIFRHPDYDTPSKDLIIINQTNNGSLVEAKLILNQTLDRDYNADVRAMHFIIQDNSVNAFQTVVVIDMYITDVNDAYPVFQNLPYRLDLREDQANQTVVYRQIRAIDPDDGIGGRITYHIQPVTQSTQDASLFLATYSIDNNTGDLTLTKSLDYEQVQVFQFNVIAEDGYGLNTTEVLTIRILDVQDTPPIFLGTPYIVTIPENTPFGTYFYTIRSLDGDRGVPNDVQFMFVNGKSTFFVRLYQGRYVSLYWEYYTRICQIASLFRNKFTVLDFGMHYTVKSIPGLKHTGKSAIQGPCRNIFQINSTTGDVTVSGDVDRDSAEIQENGGLCEIQVMVTEIERNFPQHGPNTAMTSLTIYVSDANDNHPSFNLLSFSAFIENTALLNYPIQFENKTEMVIQDLDQGSSGILELYLRGQDGDPTYDFEPIPSVIASTGRPLIALKSPQLLRMREEIILYIFAVERDTPEKFSASATITIRVLPVVSTTVSTTTIKTTTPVYLDPFIPSILGVVIPFLLLIWAFVVTLYYCLRYRRLHRNRVGDSSTLNRAHTNGHGNGTDSPVREHPPPNRNHQRLVPPVFQNGKHETDEVLPL